MYYDVFPYSQTLNSDVYCQKFDRLKEEIAQERPASVNTQDRNCVASGNVITAISILTRQNLRQLGLEALKHTPYSPDLTPTGYYLFLSTANDFASEKFTSKEAFENLLFQVFTNRDNCFNETFFSKTAIVYIIF